MYQRQVWKQLLSNKILINPQTSRFFKTSDLTELFSLQEHTDTNPETANIFRNSRVTINPSKPKKSYNKKDSELESAITFSEDKIQAMKTLAQQISKKLSSSQQPARKTNEIETHEPRPTPVELLAINRKKLEPKIEDIVNKIDDQNTEGSFAFALTEAEKCSKVYHNKKPLEREKLREVPLLKKQKNKRVKIDVSGQIDGEKVEGLIKREVKKKDKVEKKSDKSQDQYVLEKLFSRKGNIKFC